MRAYIDESGDSGIGTGSRWLVFAMVMLSEAEVSVAEGIIRNAIEKSYGDQRLKKEYFHFKDMDHEHKKVVIAEFKKAPWIACLLARDTSNVHSLPPVTHTLTLYTHMACYIMERASLRAQMLGEDATVYFEESRYLNRRTLSEFRSLVEEMTARHGLSGCVSPNNIFALGKGESLILSVADGLAHAAFRALEPHRLSQECDVTYLALLGARLWGASPLHGVDLYEHGLLLRPKRCVGKFIEEYPWLMFHPRVM